MKIIPLSIQEKADSGFTHKIILPYTDMTGWTSGTAYSIYPTLGTAAVPAGTALAAAGTRVRGCSVNVATAFTFAAGTLVHIIGDGASTARYVASTDLKTAGYTENAPTTKPHTYGAADTIDIIITTVGGPPATIAAGELHVFIALSETAGLEP